jgi:hypothetical protein
MPAFVFPRDVPVASTHTIVQSYYDAYSMIEKQDNDVGVICLVSGQ